MAITRRHLDLQSWRKKTEQGEQAHLKIKGKKKEKNFIDEGEARRS